MAVFCHSPDNIKCWWRSSVEILYPGRTSVKFRIFTAFPLNDICTHGFNTGNMNTTTSFIFSEFHLFMVLAVAHLTLIMRNEMIVRYYTLLSHISPASSSLPPHLSPPPLFQTICYLYSTRQRFCFCILCL